MNYIAAHYSSPTLRPMAQTPTAVAASYTASGAATDADATTVHMSSQSTDTLYSGSTFLSPVGSLRVYSPEKKRTSDNLSGDISNDYLERVKKSQIILEKYPDRVPLIILPSKNDRDSYPIDKTKYITPRDLTLLQLQQIIRKRIKFPAEKALFMFIKNKIYPVSAMVGTIYDTNKDPDGFLYVTYCQESTFGAAAAAAAAR
jgi:GABA(A) receptor-associated protein